MAFAEILQHVGDTGKFQVFLGILTSLINTMTNTRNFVENFSAAIPDHRRYTHLLDNATFFISNYVDLTTEALLRVSIPMDQNYKPEQGHQLHQTQGQLLDSSVSTTHISELEAEPCLSGWIYDQSVFTSTIMTKI